MASSTLTPAQIASLSTSSVAGLTTATLLGLTTAQVAAFTTAQIPALATAQIAALTPVQIAALTTADVAALTTNQVKSLATAQVASLGSLGIQALGVAQVAAFSPAGVAALTTAQVSVLSTAQLAVLTTGQIAALTTTQLSALATAQLASLTTTQVPALALAGMAALGTDQVAALAPAQIAALSAAQVRALAPMQIASLTTADIAALSSIQALALGAAQIAAFTVADIAALGTNSASALNPAAIAMMTTDQIGALTTVQVAALTTAQILALTTAQIPVLGTGAIAAFGTDQMAALTAAQIAALTSGQIAVLTTADVAALGSAGNAPPILNPAGFTTIFDDDFTRDTSLNTNLWSAHWGQGSQYWFTHGAAGLLISGSQSANWNPVGFEQAPTGRTAGEGYGLYSFTGYAGQAGQGVGICFLLWPADNVWLPGDKPGQASEIDLLESWDGTKTGVSTIHFYDGSVSGNNGQQFHGLPGIDITKSHTYSIDWERGSLAYYVDGVEIYQDTAHVPLDAADGGVNETMGAEVVNEAAYHTTPTVQLYIQDMGYSAPVAVTPASIIVSAPGIVQEGWAGAGVTLTESVVAPGLRDVSAAVYTATGTMEGGWQSVSLNSSGNGSFSVHLASSGDFVRVVDNAAAPGLTTSSSAVTITEPQPSAPVLIGGPGVIATLTAGETLYDTGMLNTLVLPGSGPVTLTGNTVNNGDLLDLRAAMATTNWDGDISHLGSYLTAAPAANGADLRISLHATGGASSTLLATLLSDGPDTSAFSRFKQHAILTTAPSGAASSPVFISGPGVTMSLTAAGTLYDTGMLNRLVFAGTAPTALSGNVVNNGDSFDLRAVMSATGWDHSSATLGNYLTQGLSANGADLQISLHATGGASSTLLVTLLGAGRQSSAFANFEQHSIV